MQTYPRCLPFLPFLVAMISLSLGCAQSHRVRVNRPLQSHDLHKEEPLYLVLSVENAVEKAIASSPAIASPEEASAQFEQYNELFTELLAFRLANAGLWKEVEIAPFKPGDVRKVWQQATFLELKTLWNLSGQPATPKVEFTTTGIMERRPIQKVIWQANIANTIKQKNPDQKLEALLNEAISTHVNEIIQSLVAQ